MRTRNKIFVLLSTLCLTVSVASATNSPFVYTPDYSDGTANVYTYEPYSQYEINTVVGFVTDIQLRQNEKVTKIATGDSVQWLVDTDFVSGTQHVYIKPTVNGLKTNLIINTDRRSYRLIVNAGQEMEYVVLWTYPKDDFEEAQQEKAAALKDLQDGVNRYNKLVSEKHNNNYKVTKNKNVKRSYLPLSIFDNGEKTYIELPEENRENMPVVYYFDEWDKGKLQLVNYRLRGNYLEIDKVMHNIKLVYSQNSYLLINKKDVDNDIPSPGKINVSDGIDVNSLYNSLSNSEKLLPVESFYIPLKERIKDVKMQEAKDFIKETQQQELSNEDLDGMIAKLEGELQGSPDVPPDSKDGSSESVQRFIDENYGEGAKK